MGDCYSQMTIISSNEHFAAVRISGVSVIVRCLQGKTVDCILFHSASGKLPI